MTNREKEYANAEAGGCYYADNRIEWLAKHLYQVPDDFVERFRKELWLCYRQAFLDGITWAEDERRTAYKDVDNG